MRTQTLKALKAPSLTDFVVHNSSAQDSDNDFVADYVSKSGESEHAQETLEDKEDCCHSLVLVVAVVTKHVHHETNFAKHGFVIHVNCTLCLTVILTVQFSLEHCELLERETFRLVNTHLLP